MSNPNKQSASSQESIPGLSPRLSVNKDYELRNSFGGIRLEVPETSSISVDAQTTFGEIRAENTGISVNRAEGPSPQMSAKGQLGTGEGKVYLRTSNGSIEIKTR